MALDFLALNTPRLARAAALSLAVLVPVLAAPGGFVAAARAQQGPASVADLSERLIDSVVNISTSQTVGGGDAEVPRPDLPEGSPFQEFFDEFFDKLYGPAAPAMGPCRGPRPRKPACSRSVSTCSGESGGMRS